MSSVVFQQSCLFQKMCSITCQNPMFRLRGRPRISSHLTLSLHPAPRVQQTGKAPDRQPRVHHVWLCSGPVVPPQVFVPYLIADRSERLEIHPASIGVSIRKSFGLGGGDCFSRGCKSGSRSNQNTTSIHASGDEKMVRYGLFQLSKGRAAEVNVLSPDLVFGTNWRTDKYQHREV